MKKIVSPPAEITNETLKSFLEKLCEEFNRRLGNIPSNSSASDIAGAVQDLNKLLDILR